MTGALTDKNEILLRQIHPTFTEDDGSPSSQNFIPTRKDNDKLSVDRSEITTPQEAYARYTDSGLTSSGVYGLSVGEFYFENIDCYSDPIERTETESENPAHAFANFEGIGTNQQKLKAKRLKRIAIARGQLHP